MKCLLVHKIKIEVIYYQTSDCYTITGYLVKRKGGRVSIVKKTAGTAAFDGKNRLTLIVISGYGVISKNRETEAGVVANVLGDGETFLYNEISGTGEVLFIRKEQMAPLRKWMTKKKSSFLPLRLVPGETEIDNRFIIRIAGEILEQEALLAALFRPTPVRMAIAAFVYKKARVVLLVFMFLFLVINILIGKRIEEEYHRQSNRVVQLQKSAGEQAHLSRQKLAALNAFKKQWPWRISMLCDCIAADVPEPVFLTRLSVQPELKRPENNKEFRFGENRLEITAEAEATEEIMMFVNALKQEPFVKAANLTSVKQHKETGRFIFHIEITL